MKLLKEIFGRLWALWGLLLFIATMLPAMVFYTACFFMKEPSAARWHRQVSRVWMWVYLHLIGCPLKVVGAHYFQKGENYIVVCNHNSLMDIPVTTPFTPQANKTIAKKEFARVPVFGWIYSLGSVLVDRKSEQSRRKSYDKMKQVLSIGLDMLIFPEGSRNRTPDPLKAFYDGAFRLAADTKKPIIPTLLFNTRRVLPAHKPFYLEPHTLALHFLPPVITTDISAKELKEKVYRQMWDYYKAHELNN